MHDQQHPPVVDISKAISRLLDFKKQGGAIGVLSVFIASVLLLLRLPDAQIVRIKELWWIISIPSILVLISWMFTAYIAEIRSRTQVEEGIQNSLATLAANFERLFAHHLDDKIYLDKRLDVLEDRLRSIYDILETRKNYIPGKDTEQFLHGKKEDSTS